MSGQKRIINHFPHFFQTGETGNLFYRFLEVFGSMLDDAENDLVRVMRAHWVDTADNEGSKGFDTNQKGDLDKIFSLYIEALGGTSLLRQINRREGAEGLEDDVLYRQRIKGLIQILKNGASTREGIIAIVAANLGIYGDAPETVAARNLINIEEYLPRPFTEKTLDVALYEIFAVQSANPEETLLDIQITTNFAQIFPLRHLTLEELFTGAKMEWISPHVNAGGNTQITLQISGEQVNLYRIMPNNTLVPITGTFSIPQGGLKLPPGVSQWQIRSEVGEYGELPEDTPAMHPNRTFNNSKAIFAPAEPVFEVQFSYIKIQPATFMVHIPWDIPGYTELIDQQPDQPRLQIPYIVKRVKAAGVWAGVAYHKTFAETQDMSESFDLQSEDQTYQDNQNMSDNFFFGGVFDVTRYDQSLFE